MGYLGTHRIVEDAILRPRPFRMGGAARWSSPSFGGSALPWTCFHRSHVTTLQVSLHVADRQVVPPRFDADISVDTGGFTTGTLASHRIGLAPAGRRELVTRLRHDRSFAVMASELLGARVLGTHRSTSGVPRCTNPTSTSAHTRKQRLLLPVNSD
jgi:hypothetical protein